MLRHKDWIVKSTHGNTFQYGFPDLYCIHQRYGSRWIEIKNPLAYSFTKAQLEFFPQLTECGIGVWILTDNTEAEYNKLFKPANWYQFLQFYKK